MTVGVLITSSCGPSIDESGPRASVSESGASSAAAGGSDIGATRAQPLGFRFVDASRQLGRPKQAARNRAYGLAAGDLDGDGRLDLLMMNHGKPPSVLLNRGPSGFLDIQPRSGLTVKNSYPGQRDRHGAAMGDYDNDGWIDLLVAHGGGRGSTLGIKFDQLLRNVGGRFVIMSKEVGLLNSQSRTRSARLVDYDRDGWLDAYLGGLGSPNALYHATEGRFEETTAVAGLDPSDGEHQSWTDIDDDGWPDLMTMSPPRLYRNRGDGGFDSVALPPGLTSRRCSAMAWGDYDADGDDDLFAVCHQGATHLWRTAGGLLESDPAPFQPVGGITDAHWVDLDQDGDLDLVAAATRRVMVYVNRGGSMDPEGREIIVPPDPERGRPGAESTAPQGLVPGNAGALVAADLDGDGDLDLAINTPSRSYLLLSETPSGTGLTLRLVGRQSNRSAIGSRIEVRAGDLEQVRRYLGSSNGSQTTGVAPPVFGLADQSRATVAVRWPNGLEQRFDDVPASGTLILLEPSR